MTVEGVSYNFTVLQGSLYSVRNLGHRATVPTSLTSQDSFLALRQVLQMFLVFRHCFCPAIQWGNILPTLKYSPSNRGAITNSVFLMKNVWVENNAQIKPNTSHEIRCFVFVLISWSHVNSEQLSSFSADVNIVVQTRFCYQSPVHTSQVSQHTSVCLQEGRVITFSAWPALDLCNSMIYFPSELFVTWSSRKLWLLPTVLQLTRQKMFKISWHLSMLLRKLCPIIDKSEDWLMGQWIAKHANDVSLTFKWGIQDRALRFFFFISHILAGFWCIGSFIIPYPTGLYKTCSLAYFVHIVKKVKQTYGQTDVVVGP